MPLVHNFGIIEEFDKEENYLEYKPDQFNCIPADDNLIQSLVDDLSIMKTYFQSFRRPEYGLAMWGITIIPPESLSLFYEVVVTTSFKESDELAHLAAKIAKAKEEDKYMIHFGV